MDISYLPHFTRYLPFCLPKYKVAKFFLKYPPMWAVTPNHAVYMKRNIDRSLLLGDKYVSATSYCKIWLILTLRISQRQLYMPRYSQATNLCVEKLYESSTILHFVGRKMASLWCLPASSLWQTGGYVCTSNTGTLTRSTYKSKASGPYITHPCLLQRLHRWS